MAIAIKSAPTLTGKEAKDFRRVAKKNAENRRVTFSANKATLFARQILATSEVGK